MTVIYLVTAEVNSMSEIVRYTCLFDDYANSIIASSNTWVFTKCKEVTDISLWIIVFEMWKSESALFNGSSTHGQ